MNSEQKKELRAKGRALKPFTSIGKNGISKNTITQISNNLRAHHLCKVKILGSFIDESGSDKKELAKELASKTQSELIDLVGFSVVLYKR